MSIRILLVICLCANCLSAQENFSQEELEVKNIIQNLPEVKAKNKVYDAITKRVQEVKMRITPPAAESNLYKVEVGYQGTGRFEPHYYFFVNAKTNLVYIEDMEKGDRPSLSEWRLRQKGIYETTDSTAEGAPVEMKAAQKPEPVNVYPHLP